MDAFSIDCRPYTPGTWGEAELFDRRLTDPESDSASQRKKFGSQCDRLPFGVRFRLVLVGARISKGLELWLSEMGSMKRLPRVSNWVVCLSLGRPSLGP